MYLRVKSKSSVKSHKEWIVELMRRMVKKHTSIKHIGQMSYKQLKAKYTKLSRF